MFEPPFASYLRSVHYRMVEPTLPAAQTQAVSEHCQQAPVFFTDGSCQFPRLVEGRFAAYASVMDSSTTEHERSVQVNTRTIGIGRVPTNSESHHPH